MTRISGLLFFLFLLGSCASSKVLTKVDKAHLDEVIDGMEANVKDYTWFSAKARVKFRGAEFNMGGRCNIRMIKDSLIWMNFKKLSIEGSRTLITKDSFWIVYRIDKMYESGTLKELLDAYKLDLTFSELQEFVVGNYPVPAKENIESFRSEYYHELAFTDSIKDYEYKLDNNFLLSEIVLRDRIDRRITGKLEEYSQSNIAHKKEFSVDLEDGSSGRITFEFSNIEIDVPKTIRFEVPSHYVRLP